MKIKNFMCVAVRAFRSFSNNYTQLTYGSEIVVFLTLIRPSMAPVLGPHRFVWAGRPVRNGPVVAFERPAGWVWRAADHEEAINLYCN